jgi:peptidoglycan/xylan/chitin deacetylase (PgdA/CDA1 family)
MAVKNYYVPLFVFFAVLEISCASRPVTKTAEITIPPELPIPKQIPIEAERTDFEYVLRNIKMNTPLIKKSFVENAASVSGKGIANIRDILVKGECLVDGKEFRIAYDLANAVPHRQGVFRVPFFVENLTDGVFRFDELFWTPMEDEAGLLLSFDDDHLHIWRSYFDVFDTYGAKVTFFVQGRLEPESENKDLADFCIDALGRGHDLGFHSVNHLDLTKVSRNTFDFETIEAAKAFWSAGIPFSAFAFPFGFSQPWMNKALAPFFPFTRGYGANIRFYNPETIAEGYIVSKAIDNIVYPDDSQFKSDIHQILFAAKFTGYSIVPFTTHDISDTAKWAIKPERLEFLLKTAQELNLRFYTYRDK